MKIKKILSKYDCFLFMLPVPHPGRVVRVFCLSNTEKSGMTDSNSPNKEKAYPDPPQADDQLQHGLSFDGNKVLHH
jgi:hypothetical protein